MHKVSCSACEQTVEISSRAAICSACGEDLIRLLPADDTPQHYYARAEKFIDQNDVDNALRVVQDGLETVISSDLLLLGAILAEKVGQYDVMRHYVSRIPVDDSLRAEGEWLLRAHQARQRAQRQGRDPSQAILEQMPEALVGGVDSDADDGVADDWRSADNEPIPHIPNARRGWLQLALPLLLLLGLMSVGWFYRGQLLSQPWMPAALRADAPAEVMSPDIAPSDGTPSDGTPSDIDQPESDPPATPTSDSSLSVQPSPEDEPTEGAPADSPSPTEDAVPTPTVSADVLLNQYGPKSPDEDDAAVLDGSDNAPSDEDAPSPTELEESVPSDVAESATREPLVDADPLSAVDVVAQVPFDVLKYLREYGRADLADLPLDAQIDDGKVIISGVVKWHEEREAILEALSFAPDVIDVNAIGLVTRTPETYTVQEADTLWIIAFRIYGDGALWPRIYELNQDTLPSPDTLGLGQVLKIPPP